MYATLQIRSSTLLSALGFSWDAMLKMTNIKLQLIADIDMYQMVEKVILLIDIQSLIINALVSRIKIKRVPI